MCELLKPNRTDVRWRKCNVKCGNAFKIISGIENYYDYFSSFLRCKSTFVQNIDGHRLHIGDESNHWHSGEKSWHASYAIKHYTVHDFHTPKGVVVTEKEKKTAARSNTHSVFFFL